MLLFLAGCVFISGVSAQYNDAANGRLFAGVSTELNNHSNDGTAIGGGLMAGYALNNQFAAGLRVSFFYDLKILSSLEPNAFFRYTLPLFENLPWLYGFFMQAEIGCIFYFYRGGVYPAFSGGLAAGWRYNFHDNFFIEPLVRFGYPHMWGIGVTAGYIFPWRRL